MKREQHITLFGSVLWQWFLANGRHLPWRDLPDADPNVRAYKVLVSEVMLQQTQVSRCIPAFRNFLRQFPTLRDLAKATNREIILAWRGMGYNNRALRLRDCAKVIIDQHKGEFPQTHEELMALPGLGHYTAGAVRMFAWNLPTPCIDVNVRRVLHRCFFGWEGEQISKERDRQLLTRCGQLLQEWMQQGHQPKDFLAALMDYGSLVQKKKSPVWEECVLSKAGLMKASTRNQKSEDRNQKSEDRKQEPGRFVGARYIPNRIFRGKVVEELRDAKNGRTLSELGKEICIDWSPAHHKEWLSGIIHALTRDGILAKKGTKFVLAE